jgi:hypothetical protein
VSNLRFQGIDREFFAHLIARSVRYISNELNGAKNPHFFDKMKSVRMPSVIDQVSLAEAVKESQWATPQISLI